MADEIVVKQRRHAVRLARDIQRGIHQVGEGRDAMANIGGQHQHRLLMPN